MYIQKPKLEIDVGEIGNGSTGDILFDGGEKINSNMEAIYNSFGDQRQWASGNGVGTQMIHATGYYQKVTGYDLKTPLAMGTQWDLDTSVSGGANPVLGKGKPGENIRFVNSNGSCSVNRPISIQPVDGSFIGVQGSLVITQPFCVIDCWCISNENNVAIWNYSISSMFGSKETPIETTKPVPTSGVTIPLAHSSEYNVIKLLVTAQNIDGSKVRTSEVNLLIDNKLKNIHDTEFAVMRIGNANEEDEIVDIKYDIASTGIINCSVTTKYPNMRIAIKSIATQRIGTA
ncbi:baseplate wedge tail fiber connector [Acinetobacter phage AB1I1M-1]